MIEVAVTGTDTGVGKTVVACAIAAALVRRGRSVGVMKPVETGVTPDALDRDSVLLRAASESTLSLERIVPYLFPDPLAPLVAARRSGTSIDLARLDEAIAAIRGASDALVVEGAGGLLVPLTATATFATLFRRWTLPIVIVAANRLGVINHVLLTVAAAERASLPVRAIVLNEVEPSQRDPSSSGNAALLRELIPGIPILAFPRATNPRDWDAQARAAEESGLGDAIAPPSPETKSQTDAGLRPAASP